MRRALLQSSLELLVCILIWLTGTGLLWLCGCTSLWGYAIVAVAGIGMPMCRKAGGYNRVLYLGVLVFAIAVSACVTDPSTDGNIYHIPTLTALLQGWNPVYDRLPESAMYDFNVYVEHYARGLEMAGLPVSALLHAVLPGGAASFALQSGKLLNLLLPLTTFLLGCAVLPAGKSRILRILSAGLFSFNPIVMAQCLTFYCDSLLYSELLLMGYALYMLLNPYSYPDLYTRFCSSDLDPYTHPPVFILFAATLLAISTKFNHLFYCCVMWVVIIVWLLIRRREVLVPMLAGWCALLLALMVVDVSPYDTNFIFTGNPFYPLMGREGFDIMTYLTLDIYQGNSRLYNEFLSLFSTNENAWALLNDPAGCLLPPGKGLYVDSRTMAYGPLFPFMLVCAIVLMVLSRERKTWLIITSLLLCAPLLIEQSWWGRYCPVLWGIVPLGFLAGINGKGYARLRKWLGGAILLMTLITIPIPLLKIYNKIQDFDPTELIVEIDKWYPHYNHLR